MISSPHKTGCARTEGYYPIPESVKATYLPKNKAVFSGSSGGALKSSSVSSRMNRVNNRRLLVGMDLHKRTTATDSDILKFNQLKSRKKQLRFAKSPIHDWGLFAQEKIDANDMVIEYVGEVIRQKVADHREKRYERAGVGSSYLFRVDDDTVIDATKMGNIARFINHCCTVCDHSLCYSWFQSRLGGLLGFATFNTIYFSTLISPTAMPKLSPSTSKKRLSSTRIVTSTRTRRSRMITSSRSRRTRFPVCVGPRGAKARSTS